MFSNNTELDLAWEYINRTSRNIFLTGKAGTGKTTFLRRVVEKCSKRLVVVSPTGIAAINAGGVTVHSFFQLPFGVCIPMYDHAQQKNTFRFTKSKLNIIRSLELIIIDEVSMLRCDLIDEIDKVLRQIRRSTKPFGGVQMLLIGDMQQLAPVVKPEEWDILREHYTSPYFFDSQVLRQNHYVAIELQRIYRQSDARFIELLASVRNNDMQPHHLELLNSRYVPCFMDAKAEGYITLATHNATCDNLNESRLEQLSGKKYTFRAVIEGTFPTYSYPQPEVLVLKKGAQVMFTKNDSNPSKRYVNGTIGVVSALSDDNIEVELQDGTLIDLQIESWENQRYDINKETQQIDTVIEGFFRHYPLKLAWAITIHKSQGLTFDRVIIDAAQAFSHGQVYVALSRCRTLEGIVLSSKIDPRVIFNDRAVMQYSQEIENNCPDTKQLESDSRAYFQQQMISVFDLQELLDSYERLYRLLTRSSHTVSQKVLDVWNSTQVSLEGDIFGVSRRFCGVLQRMLEQQDIEQAQKRTKDGAVYFLEQAQKLLLPLAVAANRLEFDNKETKRIYKNYLGDFLRAIAIKVGVWRITKDGFELGVLQTKRTTLSMEIMGSKPDQIVKFIREEQPNNEKAENPEKQTKSKASRSKYLDECLDMELFEKLREWRLERSKEIKKPAYIILTDRVMVNIVNARPCSQGELMMVEGVSQPFMIKYSEEILDIITQ